MSSLLKDEIDRDSIKKLASLLSQKDRRIDINAFCDWILTEDWTELALKQRIRKVSNALNHFIVAPYPQQLDTVMQVESAFSGLFHLIFPDFVECNGREHFERSIEALKQLTLNCSSEFAIRVFIKDSPEAVKAELLKWVQSDNEHHRRLASEGVRPRLPWATRLVDIEKNPNWVLPILEALKADSSRYVQKSVANLLNDFTKQNPQWVLKTVEGWDLEHPATFWIVKHALRNLLKQGDSQALGLMGYAPPCHIKLDNWLLDKRVEIGEKLSWHFDFKSDQNLGRLRVEYALSFLRKTLSPYRKVFKVSEQEMSVNHKHYSCRHNFKLISTRNYVPGVHKIELMVNGRVIKTDEFELIDPHNFSK